jgi:hypothetical protein
MVEDLEVGGLEKVLTTIVQGLNKNKYEVEVWCLAAGGLIADELEKNGITVRVLGLISYHNPISIIKLALLLTSIRPRSEGYLLKRYFLFSHIRYCVYRRPSRSLLSERRV